MELSNTIMWSNKVDYYILLLLLLLKQWKLGVLHKRIGKSEESRAKREYSRKMAWFLTSTNCRVLYISLQDCIA